MTSRIKGVEFDWFALDSAGCLALFATAGGGFVPESVASHFREYTAISDILASPHWGSEQVWDDYAQVGLYVYDWDSVRDTYIRVRTPAREMTDELRQKILAIASLPRFDFEFQHRLQAGGTEVD